MQEAHSSISVKHTDILFDIRYSKYRFLNIDKLRNKSRYRKKHPILQITRPITNIKAQILPRSLEVP